MAATKVYDTLSMLSFPESDCVTTYYNKLKILRLCPFLSFNMMNKSQTKSTSCCDISLSFTLTPTLCDVRS